MIRALIFVDKRLASRIALRYACRLAKQTGMDLQTIHIEDTEHGDTPPGTGWVKSTWEKGLLVSAGAEISQLINELKPTCPTLRKPKMCVGARETEILRELEHTPYDLFIEGGLFSFNKSGFLGRFGTKLYREISCPILVVKNVGDIKKAVILIEDTTDLWSLIPRFFRTLEGADLELDILHVKLQKPGRLSFKEGAEAMKTSSVEDVDKIIISAKQMLGETGWSPQKTRVIRDAPAGIVDSLQEYGLVVSCLSRQTARKSSMLELLSHVPSAVLVCWQ